MTPNKEKALVALLAHPTKTAAAAAAGIDPKTLWRYLQDPEFQEAYKKAFSDLVGDATRQAQQSLSPALSTLREIAPDLTRKQEDEIIDMYLEASGKFKTRVIELEDKFQTIVDVLTDTGKI